MSKRVRVTSNDPEQPSVYLEVEVFIKPEVRFESTSLDVDYVLASQTTVKNTYINLAGFTNVGIDSITSSSPLISAKLGEAPDTMSHDQRLKIDIVLEPGFEPGLLSETITVYFTGGRPNAQLHLYGIVVEDIQVTPLALSYIIPDANSSESWSRSRTLKVESNLKSLALDIVNVSDPAGLMDFSVTEIEPNKTFQIEATLKPAGLAPGAAMASTIVITTNHDRQQSIEIPVRIEQR